MQTTLTRLYLRWSRVHPETRDAYVRRALVNAALDERRRRTRRPDIPTAELPDRPASECPPDEPDEPLRTALAGLPTKMRAAVVLLHWLDLDPATAAAYLGCRPGTVKSQAIRGVAKLRAALDPRPTSGAPLANERSR